MATVKELLEDPQIQPVMMQSGLNPITSLFTPSKTTQSARSDGPEDPHQASVASTPTSNDLPDINKELNIYNDRLALELNNFKKQLEHVLRHQTLMQTKTIDLGNR